MWHSKRTMTTVCAIILGLSRPPGVLSAPIKGIERQTVQTEYDFIICGGGTAGLVLANRLTESGTQRVLVLESGSPPEIVAAYSPAGGNQFLGGTAIDWNFLTAEQEFINKRVLTYRRGRALGGSSVTNGLFYGRGSASIYDKWTSLGNPGWDWNSVYPFFVKSTHFNPPKPNSGFDQTYETWDPTAYSDGPLQIGFQGYVPPSTVGFMNALQAVNVPVVNEMNTGNNTGVKQGTGNLDSNYRRSSSYDSFGKQAIGRPNLDVLHYAPVQSLTFSNDSTPRATGVNFRDELTSLYHKATARKEVIVSMGAFHTPQLLMTSGIGPEAQLSRFAISPVHINENVGQHLNDHSVFSVMAKASPDAGSASPRDNNVTNLIAAQDLFYSQDTGTYTAPSGITNGFQQLSNQTLTEIGAQAVIDLGYTNRSHVEFLFENIFYPGGPNTIGPEGATEYYIPQSNESYISVTASSLVALSRGNVTLRGAGMTDIPIINPNYYADPTDRAIAINAFGDLRKILAHPALVKYTVGPNNGEVSPGVENVPDGNDEKIFEYVQANTIPNWHASGTAQMLPEKDGGVVDPRLRVYGVQNLRVIDCSIIPILPDVNIVGPVYMIAEKGAEMIKEDWGL